MDLATPPIRIGTRGSVLALAQANWVKRRIEQRCPETSVEIRVIRTGGDRFSEAPMQILWGKGVFTKEIEEALLAQHVDLAVHSLKDLPTENTPGLTIAAIPEREDPRDALVGARLVELPPGARVGTSSNRRAACGQNAIRAERTAHAKSGENEPLRYVLNGLGIFAFDEIVDIEYAVTAVAARDQGLAVGQGK